MNNQPSLNRRQFLRIVGISGAAGLALKLGAALPPRLTTVSESRLLMGTIVNLTLVTDNRAAAENAITACLDHMAGLENILSRHRPDSQLSQLNRVGVIDSPDNHLVYLLGEATRIAALTDGAFDITVKPLVDLYEHAARATGTLPAQSAINDTLALVGYRGVEITAERIAFQQPGMAVTLDGIAKGYIVDEGIRVLAAHEFTNVLIEAGGDLAAYGQKTAERPWRIGLQNPRGTGDGTGHSFTVTDLAVATSGDYMQPYVADFHEHHILDPRSGHSAPALASVTVTAPSCLLADALATALMVMPPTEGLVLLESQPGCEGYLIGKDLQTSQTAGFQLA